MSLWTVKPLFALVQLPTSTIIASNLLSLSCWCPLQHTRVLLLKTIIIYETFIVILEFPFEIPSYANFPGISFLMVCYLLQIVLWSLYNYILLLLAFLWSVWLPFSGLALWEQSWLFPFSYCLFDIINLITPTHVSKLKHILIVLCSAPVFLSYLFSSNKILQVVQPRN